MLLSSALDLLSADWIIASEVFMIIFVRYLCLNNTVYLILTLLYVLHLLYVELYIVFVSDDYLNIRLVALIIVEPLYKYCDVVLLVPLLIVDRLHFFPGGGV